MKLNNILGIIIIIEFILLGFMFSGGLINVLQEQSGLNFVAQSPNEGFLTYVNVSLILSCVFIIPMLLIFLLNYIKEAMYENEKAKLKKITRLWFLFLTLFVTGCAFGAVMIFKVILPYLLSFNNSLGYQVLYGANTVITFILLSIFYCGLIFQIPIINYYLLEFRILKLKNLPLIRMVTIIGAMFIGAVITPPDVLSMFIFSLPIWLLFEISIIIWRCKK